MKRKNLMSYGLILAGIALTVWIWSRVSGSGLEPPVNRYQVAVVVSDSTNSRWARFQAGIEKAADDYNISLNYLVTSRFESLKEEMNLITRASAGADGLIVQMEDSSGIDDLISEISRTTVLELIGTGETFAQEEQSCAGIFADDHAIGVSLAEVILNNHEGESGLRIGILSGNQNMDMMQKRLEAFENTLKEHGITPVWVIPDISGSLSESSPKVDIVVALDNMNLEQACLDLRNSQDTELYGIGCSDMTIYYLDRGTISAMIVPDDFQMGYLAVMEVFNRLQAPNIPMVSREVSFEVIDRGNLYSAKHETMLFPIIR